MKTHIKRQSYQKFKTSGGFFQINVKNRQFLEDILSNTRGRSMCRGDNDPPKEGDYGCLNTARYDYLFQKSIGI